MTQSLHYGREAWGEKVVERCRTIPHEPQRELKGKGGTSEVCGEPSRTWHAELVTDSVPQPKCSLLLPRRIDMLCFVADSTVYTPKLQPRGPIHELVGSSS